jgi:hypothetical protein
MNPVWKIKCKQYVKMTPKFLSHFFILRFFYSCYNLVMEIIFAASLFAQNDIWWGFVQLFIAIFIPYLITLVFGVSQWRKLHETLTFEDEEDRKRKGNWVAFFSIAILPIINFSGWHNIYEYYINSKKEENTRNRNHFAEKLLILTITTVTIGSTVDQNLGFVFKLYLLNKGALSGFVIIALLVGEGLYLITNMVISFIKAYHYNERKFTSFEIGFIPIVLILNKVSSILLITALLLKLRYFFIFVMYPIL